MAPKGNPSPEISIVVPVYNEEECVLEFLTRTTQVLQKINVPSEVIFIDDGSSDKTVDKVLRYKEDMQSNQRLRKLIKIKVGKMAFNVGHQKALMSGMREAKGRAVITIDSDLQDPPEEISQMYKTFLQGKEVIVMKRKNRSPTDTWFKNITAKWFYKSLTWISDVPQETEAGDFRLLSLRCNQTAIELSRGTEYIRGVINLLGVPPVYLEYLRDDRFAGETKYSLGKMLNLGINAVVKTSLKPLRKSIFLGIFSVLISLLYSSYVLFQRFLDPSSLVKGYTTLLVVNLWGFSILYVLISTLSQYVVRLIEENRNHKDVSVEIWL